MNTRETAAANGGTSPSPGFAQAHTVPLPLGRSTEAALSDVLVEAMGNDPLDPVHHRIVDRDGNVRAFDEGRIRAAITKAFMGSQPSTAQEAAERPQHVGEKARKLCNQAVEGLAKRLHRGPVDIEEVQDQVELTLMRAGEHKVARAYVIYRTEHAKRRGDLTGGGDPVQARRKTPKVRGADGTLRPLNEQRLRAAIEEACVMAATANRGEATLSAERAFTEGLRGLHDGIAENEVERAVAMGVRTLVEQDPAYSFVAAGILLYAMRGEALSRLAGQRVESPLQAEMAAQYPGYFARYVHFGVQADRLDPRLKEFDLDALGRALHPGRDQVFGCLGLQTLYDRYFLHDNGQRIELPQAFFMRVAMGLALNEPEREARAIEFYELLSSRRFMNSTPTLFNAGTCRPQLSSCFLTTVPDDLAEIYSSLRDDALLSKYAGGLGNDWSNVRAMGAHIKGTNGKSQGVVPFLKVANDTAIAVNQGGKRKGAICAYLEAWHLDIEEFLVLRKNTGDDRRRTHDMNTAIWVPDLFMRRLAAGGNWTLLSPDEVPDLHDLYGRKFEARYAEYEGKAERGELRNTRTLPALDLWKKMLSMLYETGHPWLTFKDPCNLRSPQQHCGVVHSSNLCTEITLNTSADEIAVCNLGSVNLARHVTGGALQDDLLRNTVHSAVRMLDNAIDLNHYMVSQARRSNLRHRPIGLGLMGFQDALYQLRVPYASKEAVEFADRSAEALSFHAIEASADLAVERGAYGSFPGSLWAKGVLPIDSIDLLAAERDATELQVDRTTTLDWNSLREKARRGMRNSNCLAIAPTATISNICGVTQSIEPTYQHLHVKSNMSGEFTVVNPHLVADLKERGLWDVAMVADLKYYNGSVREIERVPEDLKDLYATAFEVHPEWLVAAAARRQKWIDQSQSLNLYVSEPNGRKLDALYRSCWSSGLKTTYYLRSLGASRVEKSTQEESRVSHLNKVAVAVCTAPGEDGCTACE